MVREIVIAALILTLALAMTTAVIVQIPTGAAVRGEPADELERFPSIIPEFPTVEEITEEAVPTPRGEEPSLIEETRIIPEVPPPTPSAFAVGVSSCTNLTTSNEIFELTNNIALNQSSGICIDVQANNVTIDCRGFVIDGVNVGNKGISASGRNLVTIKNCRVSQYVTGLYLNSTSNSMIINTSSTSNSLRDFTSESGSNNNTALNLSFGRYSLSFISKDIALSNASSPAADPAGFSNIRRFVNVTNTSVDSWVFLNVSTANVAGVNQSTLRLWKYNATAGEWTNTSFFSESGVNATARYVFANITDFGSIFAPFGNLSPGTGQPIVEKNLTFHWAPGTFYPNQSRLTGSGAVDSAGDIILAGDDLNITVCCTGHQQWRIVKFDGDTFALVWNVTHNPFPTQTETELTDDITFDSSNNLYVTGIYNFNTNSQLMKINSSGSQKYLVFSPSPPPPMRFGEIAIDPTEQFLYTAGSDFNPGGADTFNWRFHKINATTGSIITSRLIDHTPNPDVPISITVDFEGNVIAVGFDNNPGDREIRIYKLNGTDLSTIVNLSINPSSGSDSANGVAVDSSNNIYVVGSEVLGANSSDQGFLRKFNSSGGLLMYKTFDFTNFSDSLSSVKADSGGNIFLIGSSNFTLGRNERWEILKLDSSGNTIWNLSYDPWPIPRSGLFGTQGDFGSEIGLQPDGGIIGIGTAFFNNTTHFHAIEISDAETVASCSDIVGPGTYFLSNNLNVSENTCMRIESDNVVFDCGGHSISNPVCGSTGVSALNVTNVTVRNCVLTNWNYGIHFNRTNSSAAQGNMISETCETVPDTGIRLSDAYFNNITNNNVSFSDVGVWLETSGNNTVSSNHALGTRQYGVLIQSSSGNNVTNNTIINVSFGDPTHPFAGIAIFTGDRNLLARNSINVTGDTRGIAFTNSPVVNNTLDSNSIAATDGWIWSNLVSPQTGTLLRNNTFLSTSGTAAVNFFGDIIMPDSATLLVPNLNITSTTVRLNASALPFLNTSAQMTFVVGGINSEPLVDLEDDGTFVVCGPPRCVEVSFGGGAFVYNVSSFTTYSSRESPISACTTITSPGSYVMNQSITNSGATICIDIQANSVTLDCQGFTIDGIDTSLSRGININGRTNVTIRNCIITDWFNGIRLNISDNNLISNNTAHSNFNGVGVISSSGVNITSNNVSFNDVGISYANSNSTSIRNNTANSNSEFGISLLSSNSNTLSDNTANSNTAGSTAAGIILYDSSSNTLNNNNLSGNLMGIRIVQSSNSNVLSNNTAQDNMLWDFFSGPFATISPSNNVVTDLDIGPIVSFRSKDIALRDASAPVSDPSGFRNISKYVNATNTATGAWLLLNVSYTDADLVAAGVSNESALGMRKYNGTVWLTNTSIFANNFGVNTTANYVFANITNFASIFAPMEALPIPVTPSAPSGDGAPLPEAETAISQTDGTDQYTFENLAGGQSYSVPVEETSLDLRIERIEFENPVDVAVVEISEEGLAQLGVGTLAGIYKAFDVMPDSTAEGSLREIEYSFRIPLSWLQQNFLSVNDVTLFRWDGTAWVDIGSSFISQDAEYAYYRATSNTFSVYAIGKQTLLTVQSTLFFDILISIGKYFDEQISFLEVVNLIVTYYSS